MSYNLKTVHDLLNDAFNSGEIETLALDVSYDVYTDFSSGMRKRQMIDMLLDDAQRNGRLPHLINYVKENNPHQYKLYAARLKAKSHPPRRQPVFGDERRLQDLQRNIDRDAKLLNQYEQQRSYTKDPRDLARIDHEIARQKDSIASYRREVDEIQADWRTAALPDDDDVQKQIGEINQQLSTISKQINSAEHRLADGQQRIREDMRQQQTAVLAHIDEKQHETVAVLLEKMDANQLELTELMYDAADQQQIAQWQAEQLTMLAQQSLLDIKRLRENQPDAAKWDNLLTALANETSWEQKLKLTIPLIPGILELENEIAVDVIPALKGAWDGLVQKVRSIRNN